MQSDIKGDNVLVMQLELHRPAHPKILKPKQTIGFRISPDLLAQFRSAAREAHYESDSRALEAAVKLFISTHYEFSQKSFN